MEQEIPLRYHPIAQVGIAAPKKQALRGQIVVASGGTSDMAVCEEAALTAETLGNHVTRLYDVGVAGLHRLLSHLPALSRARVVIAVAGVGEGALASVIWRAGGVPCHCRSHQRRLSRRFRGAFRAALHAQFLRKRVQTSSISTTALVQVSWPAATTRWREFNENTIFAVRHGCRGGYAHGRALRAFG